MPEISPPHADSPPCIPGLQLQDKIGEGGMSVVYRAVHLNLQRPVAVKILNAQADESAAVPVWLRESRLMASLAHPHVVTIYDAGQMEGHCYLATEYMAGGSLRTRMEHGRPWPLAETAPLVDRIAQALTHIHAHGVLHLDLKPENILYTADGQLKIADFGLSVPHSDAKALAAGRHYQGTPDYCAPEQRAGLALDARCDVFSLATLAYELLTGRLPGRVYVPASRRNPRLPLALDEVLRRGLARDPNERYASIAQFHSDFAGACQTRRLRIPIRLLGAVVVLGVVLAVLTYVSRRKPLPPPPSELPTRLWVLYDKPDDLSLFAGIEGRGMSSGVDLDVERVQVENPPQLIPTDLPLLVWPTNRPALVVQSLHAWGFVHPLVGRMLGQQVVRDWTALLRKVVPSERNYVQAGGFDGDCLALNDRGNLWRCGKIDKWTPTRRVALDRPDDQPDNPALLVTKLDPTRSNSLLGCYQAMTNAPPPDAVVVLRYRARSDRGRPHLVVFLDLPVVIPPDDKGDAATRIRRLARPLRPGAADPLPNRWLYQVPDWVTPVEEWQTYFVIYDLPPFPTRDTNRKLILFVTGTGRVWVDDVELFVWQPRSEP